MPRHCSLLQPKPELDDLRSINFISIYLTIILDTASLAPKNARLPPFTLREGIPGSKPFINIFALLCRPQDKLEPTHHLPCFSTKDLTMSTYQYFLDDRPLPYVAHVQINRPSKLNSFFEAMWLEFKTVFDTLSHDSETRAIILSGAGDRAFTTGLDVQAASQAGILQQQAGTTDDVARKAVGIKRHVEEFQNCISSVEKCEKRELTPLNIAYLWRIIC
jgi:hypothetical protein